jgi:hypothetical protein
MVIMSLKMKKEEGEKKALFSSTWRAYAGVSAKAE